MFALGLTNLLDTLAPTISGGSWDVGTPAGNIATRDRSEVARSADALAASTKLIIDWGSAQTARALVLLWHNLSADAQVKWSRGSASGGDDVVAGNWADVYAVTAADGHAFAAWVVNASASVARHELIEISDTGNAAGYVEIADAWIGDLWTPTYAPEYGLQDGWVTYSARERSDAGTLWTTRRRTVRSASFVLAALSLSEGDTAHEAQRVAGTTMGVLYAPYIGDAAALQRYGMVGTLDELSPVDYPYYRMRKLPLRITEI